VTENIRMPSKAVRVLVSVAIIGGALTALLATTLREDAAFYKEVDEVMVTPEHWYGKPMNLHGFVVEESVEKTETLDWRFQVRNGDKVVLATYTGVVPDTFKGGAEVVLTGKLGPEGFHAKHVSAKCPSRYDADKAEGR
jgi:cytochrome c-type biogenesis protein CcmE